MIRAQIADLELEELADRAAPLDTLLVDAALGPMRRRSGSAAGPVGPSSRAGLAPGAAAGVTVVSVGPRGADVRVRLGGGAGGSGCPVAFARGRRDRRLFAGAHRFALPVDVAIGTAVGELCGRAVRRLETHRAGVPQRGGDHDDKRR
jgi:hypothetical protein